MTAGRHGKRLGGVCVRGLYYTVGLMLELHRFNFCCGFVAVQLVVQKGCYPTNLQQIEPMGFVPNFTRRCSLQAWFLKV